MSKVNNRLLKLTPRQQTVIMFYNLDIELLIKLNSTNNIKNLISENHTKNKNWGSIGNLTNSIYVGSFIRNNTKNFKIFLKNDGYFSDASNYNYDVVLNTDGTPQLNNDPEVNGYKFIWLKGFYGNAATGTPKVWIQEVLLQQQQQQRQNLMLEQQNLMLEQQNQMLQNQRLILQGNISLIPQPMGLNMYEEPVQNLLLPQEIALKREEKREEEELVDTALLSGGSKNKVSTKKKAKAPPKKKAKAKTPPKKKATK